MNETRPHYLIELFRELQLLNSDYLRQRSLFSLHELVSRFLTETTATDTPTKAAFMKVTFILTFSVGWHDVQYLITPALFLRVALIKVGVRGASVIRAILERQYHALKSYLWYIASLACTLSF